MWPDSHGVCLCGLRSICRSVVVVVHLACVCRSDGSCCCSSSSNNTQHETGNQNMLDFNITHTNSSRLYAADSEFLLLLGNMFGTFKFVKYSVPAFARTYNCIGRVVVLSCFVGAGGQLRDKCVDRHHHYHYPCSASLSCHYTAGSDTIRDPSFRAGAL